MRTLLVATLITIAFFFYGCDDPNERYYMGYSDGYAVGYNTTCEIRRTLVERDFGNEDYARGYADGQSDGSIACNTDKKAGRR